MREILRPFVREESIDYISKNYPSIRQLCNATHAELVKIPGVGNQTARKLIDVFKLSQALLLPEDDNPIISSPSDAFNAFKHMALLEHESFVVCFLNTKNRIIHHEEISKGTLNTSLVHPREVFSPAIRIKCANLVLLHNHPSGDPTPSREDLEITRRLVEAGKLIGISVLDHIVIGGEKFVSFTEKGLL